MRKSATTNFGFHRSTLNRANINYTFIDEPMLQQLISSILFTWEGFGYNEKFHEKLLFWIAATGKKLLIDLNGSAGAWYRLLNAYFKIDRPIDDGEVPFYLKLL